jgi:hypothetical protein
MESLQTMGREWAGPRIGTPHTGSRTETIPAVEILVDIVLEE